MAVLIDQIQFNIAPEITGRGGLNIRRDVNTPVQLPEWKLSRSLVPADSPAAYSLQEIRGHRLQIKAQFRRLNKQIHAVQVRAVPAATLVWPDRPFYLPDPQLLWPGNYWFSSLTDYQLFQSYGVYYRLWQSTFETRASVLGLPAATWVVFRDDDTTGMVTIDLVEGSLQQRGTFAEDIHWQWQYRFSPSDPWIYMNRTSHRIYGLPGLPQDPWLQQPMVDNNSSLPWTEALEFACKWASGATNREEVATAVTQAIFGLGEKDRLAYGCSIGALTMYQVGYDYRYFDLDAFIDLLQGGIGRGAYVNCTDCATAVVTFSNLLGCELWESRMGSYSEPFVTNRIRAIGSDEFESPCGWGLGFTYHEVAWTGSCGADDAIYDACLEVLQDPNALPGIDPPISLLPTGMRFGESGDGVYKDRIAAPNSRAFCIPRPAERLRREILPIGN
jgi:hypothetical protein